MFQLCLVFNRLKNARTELTRNLQQLCAEFAPIFKVVALNFGNFRAGTVWPYSLLRGISVVPSVEIIGSRNFVETLQILDSPIAGEHMFSTDEVVTKWISLQCASI
jgi:hypothetical protein